MPWVDGLRAISILGVVAFHAGISPVSGGFTGVDVFFVISGFLIIGQIMAGLEAGRFTIFGFYARRTMRILPPYFLMLVVVALIAPLLLVVPKAYEMQAKASVLAPLMATNILFYIEQGYFDPAASQKPLIHTWTLAVEEQFYLIIPLALVLLYRLGGRHFGTRTAWIAGAVGLVSFAGCVFLTETGERNPAFYLTHLRAWEFIAGGFVLPLVAYLKSKASGPLAGFMALIGIVLIAVSFFGLSGADSFPGWRAAIPVLGAVLVLAGMTADPQSLAAAALSHRVPVRIGLVSYSWYLWHWPLLSLASLAGLGPESWRGVVFAGVLGYLMAELSYKFVELPVKRWRHRRAAIVGDRKIFLSGVGAAFIVAAVCGGVTGLGYLRNMAWLERTYGFTPTKPLRNGCQVVTGDRIDPACLKGDYVLLFGDSHAGAVASVFEEEMEKTGVRLVAIARGGCDPAWFTPQARAINRNHRCANLLGPFEAVLDAANAPKAAIIVTLFDESRSRNSQDMAKLAESLTERGTAVMFVGPVPVFPQPALDCIVTADRKGQSRDVCAAARSDFAKREAAATALVIPGISGLPLAAYVPISDVFCDPVSCRPWDGDKLLFWDSNHVVDAGARKVFDAIRPRLEELLAAQAKLN